MVDVKALAGQIASLDGLIEGLSISGGEPFQQPGALAALCSEIRQRTKLSILIFSGFEMAEIKRIPESHNVLEHIDVIVTGRYRQELRLAQELRGSLNKKIIFLSERYTAADFTSLPDAEIIITGEGEVLLSGIDPVQIPPGR